MAGIRKQIAKLMFPLKDTVAWKYDFAVLWGSLEVLVQQSKIYIIMDSELECRKDES